MDEYRRLVELIRTSTCYETKDSFASFSEEFNAFMQEMNISQNKRQIIMNKEDAKPCILNING